MKAKFLLKAIFSSLIFSLILFLSAGKINYYQGWIFLTINLVTTVMNFWTIRNDQELMTERANTGKGTKTWDKIILGLSALVYLITIIIAGLDSGRFQWSPEFCIGTSVAGVILMLIGQIIFLSARKENRFFSSIMRIQTERGHFVCDTGIYKLVRHPGYLGMMISLASLPLISGSVYSAIPVFVAIVLLFIRTYLEDETLKKELPGYHLYCEKTRKRMLPLIW